MSNITSQNVAGITPALQNQSQPGATPQHPIQTADHGERYWLILQNIIEWLRFSEGKAGLILTSYGVLFTIIYTNANSVFAALNVNAEFCLIALVVMFGFASLISIWFAFMTVKPQLNNPGGNSILYFRNIRTNYVSSAAYKTAAHAILDDEDKYTDHLTEQIYILSKIADNKYISIGRSVWCFAISLVILNLIVIVYFFKNLTRG